MPVEIRELIIKTEVRSVEQNEKNVFSRKDIIELKKQLLIACKRMVLEQTKKSNFKR